MLLPDWHAQRTFLANLDVLLSIYDGAGNLVAASDATGLPGALNTTLPAGTYYVAVDGTAQGDPLTSYNDYDSLGQYTLTGTVQPTGNQAPVAVASASVTSGSVPLDVVFSSAGRMTPMAASSPTIGISAMARLHPAPPPPATLTQQRAPTSPRWRSSITADCLPRQP